jgi:parallel beta-helix repeat protein
VEGEMRTLTFVFACLVLVIPCQAEIITVDDDGPANFNNIQDAINYSWHGDTVIVNPGTYHENVYFNGRAITLTSQDPNDPNVVESTIIRADSSYSVTFDFGEGSDSVLTGFTITGRGILCYASSPTITKNIVRDCATGGVYGQYSAAPIISDNMINSNSNRGIYDSDGIITNNTISDNRGGVAYCDGTISYNTIVNNDIVGDGAGLYDCDATITNNIISNNYCNNTGGGLYGCDGEIIDNIITDNYAGNGGGLRDCTGTINDNIIAGNQAQTAGGGLHYCIGNISNNIITGNKSGNYGGGLNGCGVSIYNNTIVGNIALQNGGALYECNGSVHNNIIAFNKASSIGGIYGPCNNSYNAFWMNEGGNFGGGATVGPNDIYVAPLFAADGYRDPNGTPEDTSDDFWVDGDYHLKSEAGRWDPPNSDWTAELWPNGKWVNMGAYGGTRQASMSLLDLGNIADLNIDGFVDYLDMIVLTKEWLDRDILLSGDLSRDGFVNLVDFAIFANNWQVPPPGQASNPNPADGAEYVSTDADLNWTAGLYTTSHDVYFGTSSTPPFIRN